MGSKRRSSTLTRFLEDIVDDTKDFVDDLLDRAKDVEANAKGAVMDVTDDDGDGTSAEDVAALKASLSALQAKVVELTTLQAKSSKN
jgi:polyhydroxyalkanoate synthesis regulator phasin